MTKQHQILAVEPTRQKAADLQLADCTATFSKKDNLFSGRTRTLTMFGKDDTNTVELTAIEAKERADERVQYKVSGNLNYMAGIVGSWFDVVFAKELTNQQAVADVKVNGEVVISQAPATYLLFLENKLSKLRDLYAAIPTLAPGLNWEPAPDIGPQIWKTAETADIKTVKTIEHVRLSQTSDKHPDTFLPKDVIKNVGQYKDRKFSGMISVAAKAEIIARLDQLTMAVKDARQRANEADAVELKTSMNIFAYLHGEFHNENEVKAALAGTAS